MHLQSGTLGRRSKRPKRTALVVELSWLLADPGYASNRLVTEGDGMGQWVTDGSRHGDGIRLGGIDYSIRPGAPCPATVLVVLLSEGSCLLVGYPEGEPAAFVTSHDAGPLRQELDRAFEHPERMSGCDDGTVAAGSMVGCPRKVQP